MKKTADKYLKDYFGLDEWLMDNYSKTPTLPDDNYKIAMEGYYIKKDTYSNFGHNWETIEEIYNHWLTKSK